MTACDPLQPLVNLAGFPFREDHLRMKNVLIVVGLVFFGSLAYALDTIDLSESQIAGIEFTDDLDHAKSVLGRPTDLPPPCIDCTDRPQSWAGYDGLKIWHSYGEIFRFTVTSPQYRLRSGIGVGSSRAEIVSAFGEGQSHGSNGNDLLTYSVTWKNGQATRLVLEFEIDDGTVTSFEVTPR